MDGSADLGDAAGGVTPAPHPDARTGETVLSTAELAGWAGALRTLTVDVDDAERIDQLRMLEELKSAAAATQAVVTAAFARSQRLANGLPAGGDDEDTNGGDDEVTGGVGDEDSGGGDRAHDRGVPVGAPSPADRQQQCRRAGLIARSIRSQVALARKDAPHRGGRHIGLAEVLVHEMPHTLNALADGTISEWRATLICRETTGLSREHRATVDTELAGRLAGAGDRRVAHLARAAAYRLDPQAVTDRSSRAASDRRITIRPAPDTMTYLSALLPVTAGVAVYAELGRAADSAAAAGDTRGRGQLMADTLVDRILHPDAASSAHTETGAHTETSARPDASPESDSAANAGTADDTTAGAANNTAPDAGDDATTIARTHTAGTDPDHADPDHGDPDHGDPDDNDPDDDDRESAAAAVDEPGGPAVDDPVAAVRAAYAAAQAREQAWAREQAQAQAHGGIAPGTPAPRPRSGGRTAPIGDKPSESPGTPANPGSGGPPPDYTRVPPPDPGGRSSPPPAVGVPPGVNLEIGLIITDQALFGDDDEPALLDGNVIPAGLARALVADLPARSKAWIRRLYTRPDTGQLAAMDSRRRLFGNNLRRFILLRDQHCRTPWCDAPIRHADHVQPAARGGPTRVDNGDGLSQNCNYVREAPGWHATTTADGDDTLTITTPTGHTYASNPPALHRPHRHAATGSEGPA